MITYKLTNYSIYKECVKTISGFFDSSNLTNSSNHCIVTNEFHIPYFYCQGSYSDSDVMFNLKLFYSDIIIYECDIEFELFEDCLIDLVNIKTYKMIPKFINPNYKIDISQHTPIEDIELEDIYILDSLIQIELSIKYNSLDLN